MWLPSLLGSSGGFQPSLYSTECTQYLPVLSTWHTLRGNPQITCMSQTTRCYPIFSFLIEGTHQNTSEWERGYPRDKLHPVLMYIREACVYISKAFANVGALAIGSNTSLADFSVFTLRLRASVRTRSWWVQIWNMGWPVSTSMFPGRFASI